MVRRDGTLRLLNAQMCTDLHTGHCYFVMWGSSCAAATSACEGGELRSRVRTVGCFVKRLEQIPQQAGIGSGIRRSTAGLATGGAGTTGSPAALSSMNVEVSAPSVGRIGAKPGDVGIHGNVSCSFPGEVDIYAYLVQQRGETRTDALSHVHLPCRLASEWSLVIPSPDIPYRAGWATLYLFAAAGRDGTTESAYADTSGPIQLKGSGRKPESQDVLP